MTRIKINTFIKQYMLEPQEFSLTDELQDTSINIPQLYLWSVIEGDSGRMYLVSGMHKVNNVGYLMSKISHENNDIEVFGL